MKTQTCFCRILTALPFLFVSASAQVSSAGHKFKTLTNDQALEILATVKADLKEHYCDPMMGGLDLDARFEKAKTEIQSAKSQDEALLDVAGAVAALGDSHTRFVPPVRPYGVDYGWLAQPIGELCCFVTAVRGDSDAAQKGLKAGDQIEQINGITLTRQDIRYVDYSYAVFPQSGLHLKVKPVEGAEHPLTAMAKVMPGQELVRGIDVRDWFRHYQGPNDRSRYYLSENRILVWKLPDFLIVPAEVDGLLNKARSYQALILDLRGNPGGVKDALLKFVGGVFDHDVKIGDEKGRKESTPLMAKSRGSHAFGGKLIVLIDSKSASASEIFARVVQLEKRGVIVGDRSAGAVTEARRYVHAVELDRTNVAQFQTQITEKQLFMTDGKTIEGAGVTPDETILPTPSDMASNRDPALARAFQICGVNMTADEAGKVLPFVWPKEQMPGID
jgi:C-terminal processing protease CtpA/Prc